MRAPAGLASREMLWITQSHSLHSMGDDEVCNVSTEPSERGMLTRNTSLARVLFFLDPATPIRASTSAFLSFRIPTQSTLWRHPNISWSLSIINTSTTLDHYSLWMQTWKSDAILRSWHVVTYARVILLLGSKDTSMTVVPSMSTSLQAVVLRPVTLQAW